MTVEIAVMNQQAVALAADSAVTVQGERGTKIYTSANKIFALSKYWPIGVMVYGSANVSGLPWETVIKVYREELGDRRFDNLPDQADHFLSWIASTELLKGEVEAHFVQIGAGAFLMAVRNSITEEVARGLEVKDSGELTLAEVRKITRDAIKDVEQNFVATAPERNVPAKLGDEILAEYRTVIDETIDEIFEELPLSAAVRKRLRILAVAPFVRQLVPEDSGIVVAGFGHRDYLPRLRSYHIDGVVLGHAIYSDYTSKDLSHRHEDNGYVAAFAQGEFIMMFMEGVHPSYEAFIESYFGRVIDRFAEVLEAGGADDTLKQALEAAREELQNESSSSLAEQRWSAYIHPVLDAVGSLPKDELASLAESLVNLTVLKKRVSPEEETVAGPVDVAVISKGDGLIWMQRKHYFDPLLNQQFFANYYRRLPNVKA